MNLARLAALQIPALRRLRDRNQALLATCQALRAQLDREQPGSPFHHYNAAFDPIEIMRRHAVPDPPPRPGFLVNFLGVAIDPSFLPAILAGKAGQVEPIPIPANWHADIAEWGAALRAVDLAGAQFTAVELGCGWGCWLNNAGAAARRTGRNVALVGIEADPGHLEFARQSTRTNGFAPDQVHLHHGVAAATSGVALFPRQAEAGHAWGLEPVFGADPAAQEAARRAGSHDILPMRALADLLDPWPRVDLLHVDIQGGEAALVAGAMPVLQACVAYMVVGTHSREIEGALFATLRAAGWTLEIERPAILALGRDGPAVTVDGVQGWRNPMLLPAA